MREISFAEALTEELDFRNICVIPVREPLGREAVFTDTKRHCNVLFLYLVGKRQYTCADGRTFPLRPNEILYVPQHAHYRFRIVETDENDTDYAIAVNFEMYDQHGEAVRLCDVPTVITTDTGRYRTLFQKMITLDTGAPTGYMPLKAELYTLCYELFSQWQHGAASQAPWHAILPAVARIESMPSEDVPIPMLARQCGLSETRFRQLFKLYTGGESAVGYRNRLRLQLVERLLHTEQVTVETAARRAGFRDMSHYYRLYRRQKHQ